MNARVKPAEILPPAVESPIVEFSQTAAGLSVLRAQITGAQYDCTTTEGDKRAREDRRMCVRIRTELKAKHAELKRPVLDRSRLLDGELNRITAIVQELEAIPDAAIKAQEAIEESARAERQRIEAERQARIDREITRISNLPVAYVSATAAVLRGVVHTLAAEHFEELGGAALIRAQEAKAVAQVALQELLAAREAAEAERLALEAQRAAQDRLIAEQREAQRLADAEAAQARRIADEQAQADRERLAEESRRESDARRAEAERLEAEARTAAETHRAAEQAKIDEQRAELLKQQAMIETQRVREQAKRESDAIAKATLVEAAAGALELLRARGDGEHLVTRKLAAALARATEAKPAPPAPKAKRAPAVQAVQS